MEQEVKKNSLILIGVFAFAYALNFASPLFAQILHIKDSFQVHPFPFHGKYLDGTTANVTIADITYTDYSAKCAAWIVVIAGLFYILPKYREILFMFLVANIGYMIEFAMIYNDPITWYGIIPVMYSTLAMLCMIVIFIFKYFKG